MRLMFGLILVIGMALAGFAVYMAQDQFKKYQDTLEAQRRALAQNVPLTQIFVATRPLRYGETLTKEDVRLVPWPETALPEGAFKDPAELFSDDPDKPRVVLRAVEKDEPILAVKVTAPGEDAGVSSRLAPGMRAFAIRVDVASGVSGFLRPGDRVDVYWTGESRGREVTKLIQDGVELIAVDQIADADRNRPVIARTVTVEVTPESVAKLAQAQATGTLSLSLRGASDNTVSGQIEVDQEQLLGIQAEAPKEQPKQEKVCTIKTRKGGEVLEIPIPCSN